MRKLNVLLSMGVRPADELTKDFLFKFERTEANDQESEKQQFEDRSKTIEQKLEIFRNDLRKRVRSAEDKIRDWKEQKTKMLNRPHQIPNFFGLQLLGRSLIKLSETNFQFFIKFYDPDLVIKFRHTRKGGFQKEHSEEKLLAIQEVLNSNGTKIRRKIEHLKDERRESLDHLKYLEIDMNLAYRYVLHYFEKVQDQDLSAGQILFCSCFTKWSSLESKFSFC